MTKKKRIMCAVAACALSASLAVSLTACNTGDDIAESGTVNMISASIVVNGYDWGPGVSAVIAKFDKTVSSFTKDTFTVKTANATRTVSDVYSSDKNGNKSATATEYVTFELTVDYNSMTSSSAGSPFTYDWQATQRNVWSENYNVSLTVAQGKSFTVGGKTVSQGTYTFNANSAANRILETDKWIKDSYTYKETGKQDITLSRASWSPVGATTDSGKNPLIIWLHGGGEGGTDIDIALLGNEVTGLTSDHEVNVQGYFKSSSSAGAYVLAVQTPTMWMDELGNGEYGDAQANTPATGEKQTSYYTEALFATIQDYVTHNTDVDTDRIYIGGCSNGGYMTMNLAFEHGDYFAAYYPVCQGYKNGNISDTMVQSIKDYNIWFTLSAQDTTLTPSVYTLPLYARLIETGAENVHLTYLEKVTGNDSDATYNGHWSWIHTFNDDVKKEFDNSALTGITAENYADKLLPANCNKDGNMWQWIAGQTNNKSSELPPEQPGEMPEDAVETYTFEAENAVITNGKAMQQTGFDMTTFQPIYSEVDVVPTIETGNEYTADGSDGDEVTNVGYFYGTGTSITWTIYAEEECDVTITLRAAGAVQDQSGITDWQTGEGLKFAEVDMSENKYLTMTVNGTLTSLDGTLPGMDSLNWGSLQSASVYKNFGTATTAVHLNKGANTIVLTPNAQAQSGLNIDKITVSGTTVKLSYLPADNSDRALLNQPQG